MRNSKYIFFLLLSGVFLSFSSVDVDEKDILNQWDQLFNIPDHYEHNHSSYVEFHGQEMGKLFHSTYAAIMSFYDDQSDYLEVSPFIKPELESPLHLTDTDYKNHPELYKLSYLEEYLLWITTKEKIDLIDQSITTCNNLLEKSLFSNYGQQYDIKSKYWFERVEVYEKHKFYLERHATELEKYLGIKDSIDHPSSSDVLEALYSLPTTSSSMISLVFHPSLTLPGLDGTPQQVTFNSTNDFQAIQVSSNTPIEQREQLGKQLASIKHYLTDKELIEESLNDVNYSLEVIGERIHEIKMDFEEGSLNWNDVALVEQEFFLTSLQKKDLELFEGLNLIEGAEIRVLAKDIDK